MRFDLGPELEDFRAEVRRWIAENAPAGLTDLADWRAHATAGSNRRLVVDPRHPVVRAWEERLLADRWICPQWPEEHGGRGLDQVRLAVLDEEFYAAGVPRITRGSGETLLGPVVIEHGTPEQQQRFLPGIIAGTDVYCQGFSEPDAGSDLAAMQTVGVIDDDVVRVTGQKVWTSDAADATMIFLLCRTGEREQRHRNLSFVVMSMDDPGIEVRPIVQITGAGDFAEVFFNGAQAPVANIVGDVDNGWYVAMSTLTHERMEGRATQQYAFARYHRELVDEARASGRSSLPGLRHRIVDSYIRLQLMRMSNVRTIELLNDGRPLGPEVSLSKLRWSEYYRDFGELAMEVRGLPGLAAPAEGDRDWHDIFLSSRACTIYSGTSEIQRHIIATKELGLPRR